MGDGGAQAAEVTKLSAPAEGTRRGPCTGRICGIPEAETSPTCGAHEPRDPAIRPRGGMENTAAEPETGPPFSLETGSGNGSPKARGRVRYVHFISDPNTEPVCRSANLFGGQKDPGPIVGSAGTESGNWGSVRWDLLVLSVGPA